MPGRDGGGEGGAGLRMDGAADHDHAAAPPILPDPGQVPEKVAEEILRQAQKLIETQIAASNALDAKLNAVVQQCITLTLASFAAAASSLARDAWLPPAAAVGLTLAALLWSLAAVLAVRGLNTSEVDAPARRPRRLWRAGIADIGLVQTYALIAGELDAGISRNTERAKVTARRYGVALKIMTVAPMAGLAVAVLATVLMASWWLIPILLILVPGVLPSLWRGRRRWMGQPEGFDDHIRADGVAGKRVE